MFSVGTNGALGANGLKNLTKCPSFLSTIIQYDPRLKKLQTKWLGRLFESLQ